LATSRPWLRPAPSPTPPRTLWDGTDFGDNIRAALPDVIAQTIGDVVRENVKQERAAERRQKAKFYQSMGREFESWGNGNAYSSWLWDRYYDASPGLTANSYKLAYQAKPPSTDTENTPTSEKGDGVVTLRMNNEGERSFQRVDTGLDGLEYKDNEVQLSLKQIDMLPQAAGENPRAILRTFSNNQQLIEIIGGNFDEVFFPEDLFGLKTSVSADAPPDYAEVTLVDHLETSASPVSHPNLFWSMVPVIGSAWEAIANFQEGDFGWAAFNAAMAVSDAFLVKGIAVGIGRGGLKMSSHSWTSMREWMRETGHIKKLPNGKFEIGHHSLIPQGGWGKYVPDFIKNQPWNIKSLNAEIHKLVHGKKVPGMNELEKFWYGTPDWFKGAILSVPGHPAEKILDDESR
jgi:hypothetical protein